MKNMSLVFTFLILTPLLGASQSLSFTEYKTLSFNDYVRQTKFSPFSNYIAVAIGDNSTELYDKNWNKLWSSQGDRESVAGDLAFSPDERFLAFSKYRTEKDIAILKLSDKQIIQSFTGHREHITSLIYSPDGKYLVSGSQDSTFNIWVWDGAKFSKKQKIKAHEGAVESLAFSPDGKILITGAGDGTTKIWGNKNDSFYEIQNIPGTHFPIYSMASHPEGKHFVTGSGDFKIRLYSFENNKAKEITVIDEPFGWITALKFSPDGNYLAAARGNATVKIYKYANGEFQEEKILYVPPNKEGINRNHIFDVDFSEDGKFLSASSNPSSSIWKTEGLNASGAALIQQYIGTELTIAQKKVLTPLTRNEILNGLEKTLTAEKDEFETNQEYLKRKEKLSAQVQSLLQKQVEKFYGITEKKVSEKNWEIRIKPESLGSYDAEKETFTISFMGVDGMVAVPRAEAKAFKENWSKSEILGVKQLNKTGLEFNYRIFSVECPPKKIYPLTLDENPFNPGVSGIGMYETKEIMKGTVGDIAAGKLIDNNTGKNYALILATNDYDQYEDLTNPMNDAKTIAEELKRNYLFETEILENATLDELVSKLRHYAQKTYNNKDQLFIFIAGHGKFDDVFKEGYVVAKNSQLNDVTKTSLLSHSNLRTVVNNIPCHHIFLVMDVCFGGTFDQTIATRGGETYSDVTKSEFIERKLKHKTRLYLTSGGKEYVPDGRPGEHSPFARKFLEALRSYGGKDAILTTAEIFTYVEKVVPQPRVGEFGSNEPGSDFIFIAK